MANNYSVMIFDLGNVLIPFDYHIVIGKLEKIETGLGKIDCYVLLPTVDKGKLLNRSDGLKFYISNKTNLPVLLEFDYVAQTGGEGHD